MHRFRNILFVPLAEGGAQAALRRTLTLAMTNQAALTVFGVVSQPSRVSRVLHRTSHQLPEVMASELRQALNQQVKKLRTDHCVTVQVAIGTEFVAIIERVLNDERDLLVITDDGPDSATASTTKHVLRKCPCPVWVMRPSRARRQRILAAIDPQPGSGSAGLHELILDLATSHAKLTDAEIHIAHAWSLHGESTLRTSPHLNVSPQELEELLDRTKAEHRRSLDASLAGYDIDALDSRTSLVKGRPGDVIPDLVARHRINLLIMGTVGRSKAPGVIIGNSAERILDRVRCSVLAVKPADFTSPVGRRRHS